MTIDTADPADLHRALQLLDEAIGAAQARGLPEGNPAGDALLGTVQSGLVLLKQERARIAALLDSTTPSVGGTAEPPN